ncbi:MAG: Gfo/Idh/MocA family oxidoreductase [Candidatus Hydrogenedentes bacterium]|nr:Gfo/Idh/MocA family oxidoreductase [Candidatus Hydrogenedentota bacterium]
MKPVRIGVIGVGHLGYHHVRNYQGLEEACVVGVVDADRARAEAVAGEFGVPAFESAQALFEEGVDAVSIVVPTTAHRDVALEALDAGAHVLVEKPIAATPAEAREMNDRARAAGRILQVGHIERFNGAVIALFEGVGRPLFIECHRLSPYPNRSLDVSVVLDLMIHDLDIVRALDGTEVTNVDAAGASVFSASEDIANARLRFASGCVANITASRVSMERMRKIRVFAENAYVSTDYSAQEVLVYRKKAGPIDPSANPMEQIEIEPLAVEREEPLKLELRSFVRCVRDQARPVVSGEDALAALELAQRVVDAIREQA